MKFSENLTPEQKEELASVYDLAETCKYDAHHAKFVTELSLQLFDVLRDVHHLGDKERFWLICAGLLHNIGWVEGKKHAKKSQQIILNTSLLHMKNKERLIIGSISRYHCGEIPDIRHDHFAALRPQEQTTAMILSAILQIAEALDHTHQQKFTQCKISVTENKVKLKLKANAPCSDEIQLAKDRSKLLRDAIRHKIQFTVTPS